MSLLLSYSFQFYFSALILLYIGEVMYHHTNERICHSRWWERHVATLKVSGTRMVADRSSRHHRHPTSRNTWLPKLSYCANSSKGSSSEVDAMTTSPSPQRTRISLGHNLLCSTGRRNHLMRTLGLRQLSPSLTC